MISALATGRSHAHSLTFPVRLPRWPYRFQLKRPECSFLFQLIALGVSPDLLSVTSSNAKSLRFDGKRYFSGALMSSKEGVRTEDGGLLHVGTDGCVGLEEIQR